MNDETNIVKALILIMAGVMIGFVIGAVTTKKDFRDEAVDHNKAEYYLDNNNNRQWRWKE